MKQKVVILGAGVSGLTAGWILRESGFEVDILETSSHPGGLCGTHRENGFCIDYGPHSFFTDDPQIENVFHNLFDVRLPALKRRVKFMYNGKHLDYPLNLKDVLFQMGLRNSFLSIFSFIQASFLTKPKNEEETVEDWAKSNFGNHLYQTFFKPYTEQFWQIPANKLSARAIPTTTRQSFLKTLFSYLSSKKNHSPSTSTPERETLPTFYPSTGYGEIPELLAARFMNLGGKLHTSSTATKLQVLNSKQFEITSIQNGETKRFIADHVVSTIPISNATQLLESYLPAEAITCSSKLQFRPIVVLGLTTSKAKVLQDWMYVYYLDRPYNRIYESTKFSLQTCPNGKNMIALELKCALNDSVWKSSKQELMEIVLPYLKKDGLLDFSDIEDSFLIKSKNAYPIYHLGYTNDLGIVFQHLSKIENFHLLGRSGRFQYMDADRCMRQAIDLAASISSKLVHPPISMLYN